MLNDLYFKTTCNIRPLFLGPMGGLKIEGPLYIFYPGTIFQTSIATRYSRDVFVKQYTPTVGLDFFLNRVVLTGKVQ